MKKPVFIFCIFVSIFTAQAQDSTRVFKSKKKNFLYGETSFTSYTSSLNYERKIFGKHSYLAVRVGFGAYIKPITDQKYKFTFPLSVNYFLGWKAHFLEVGLGLNPTIEPKIYGGLFYEPSMNFGYRFQPTKIPLIAGIRYYILESSNYKAFNINLYLGLNF